MGSENRQASQQPSLNLLQFDLGANSADNYINLFTGTVTFPLTLFTLTGRNDFNYSASITYQSNVQSVVDRWNLSDQTGVLGLGWELSIDRITVDTKTDGSTSDDIYYLILNGNTQQLVQNGESNGVLSFELGEYKFWKINYTPELEEWNIIKDDGTILTFGGEGETIGKNIQSNVLQYGILWDNWVGNTTCDSHQGQYVSAWNLAKIENHYGNYCLYNYDAVEQSVGSDTLKYTKACYLSAVQNDLGWSCVYHYLPMTYDNSSLNAPKEYLQPRHDPSVVPNDTGDAYQSQYVDSYLDHIEILNNLGEQESYCKFEYFDLTNLSDESVSSDLAYGATYKRYLKSVVSYNAQGQSKPGIQFNYCFSSDSSDHRGALQEVIYPAGGRVNFDYTLLSVGEGDSETLGSRNVTIQNPCKGRATAKSWFSDDYTVLGWYDSDNYQLVLTVYTWVGRWCESETFTFDDAFDFDSLEIATSENNFLLLAPSKSSNKTDVYLFCRNILARCDWNIEQDENGNYKSYNYSNKSLTLQSGLSFYLLLDKDEKTIDRFTWNWLTKAWEVVRITDDGILAEQSGDYYNNFYITAVQNYYLVLCYNYSSKESTFSIYYRDQLLNWYSGGTLDTDQIYIKEVSSLYYCNFAPSESFAALAVMTSYTSGSSTDYFDYSLFTLSWDADFSQLALEDRTDTEQGTFTHIPANLLNAVGPTVIENQFIGSLSNALLFDGESWMLSSLGLSYTGFSDYSTQYYWYAYYNGSLLKTENTSSGTISMLENVNFNALEAGWVGNPPIINRS